MMSHEKALLLIIYSFAYCKQSTAHQWVGGMGTRLAETELLQSGNNFIPGTDCHLIITNKMLIFLLKELPYMVKGLMIIWYTQYLATKLHSIATVI